MKVLVTGGTGFVGGALIEDLGGAAAGVRALVRPTSNRERVESLGAEACVGDLDDFDSLRRACAGCDVVYHAAAHVEMFGPEAPYLRTTVEGTSRLVRAAAEERVRRIVYVSSGGVYHPAQFRSGNALDESTPVREPPRWAVYGRAKYLAERVVRDESPPHLEWSIVRLGAVYGPRNHTMQTHLLPALQSPKARIIGNGENRIAHVYVGDAASAIRLAGTSEAAAGEALIAVSGEPLTQRTYLDTLADGFGIPRVRQRVPFAVAWMFGWLGEKRFRDGKDPRALIMNRSVIALAGLTQVMRSEHTQALLGWRPQTSFADGMRAAFEWYHASRA